MWDSSEAMHFLPTGWSAESSLPRPTTYTGLTFSSETNSNSTYQTRFSAAVRGVACHVQYLAYLEWSAIRQGALLSDIKLLSQLSRDSVARMLVGINRADEQGCSNSRCSSCSRYLLLSGRRCKSCGLRLCWYAE